MHGSARRLLDQARHEGWAIGAFNAANLETLRAIFAAAAKLEAPVIIESSPGETAYVGSTALRAIVDAYAAEYNIQVLLNLDHAVDQDATHVAIEAGYDLIHFDGGELEYSENVRLTSAVVRAAHRHHALVEGEIDHITGSSDDHRTKRAASAQQQGTYTDPDRAKEFVRKTNIDTLAVFIGNVHGLYKDPPTLDFERLSAIRASVGSLLSLHGGSGIADADIRRAIAGGVSKVNVNSELRVAYLEALQQAVTHPKEIAAYKFMPPVIEAVQQVVEAKIKLCGSVGKAKRTWMKRVIA